MLCFACVQDSRDDRFQSLKKLKKNNNPTTKQQQQTNNGGGELHRVQDSSVTGSLKWGINNF